jgi:mono/diheme cytochrome c family protein
MKSFRVFIYGVAGLVFASVGLFAQGINPTNPGVSTTPVYVPDTSHAGGPLPDGILAWDNLMESTNAEAGQAEAHFVFNFTNISSGNVVILNVHPSCGCTTVQLPPLPWTIPPGTNGQIGLTVNLAGKSGSLFKTANVSTDKGSKDLSLRITIVPVPAPPPMSDDERARNLAAAKVDPQAIFKGDCVSCHVKTGEGKYGQPLYEAVCGVCHDSPRRADIVPDLHNLKVPTNDEFWRTWTAHGRAGTLMPAFSTAEGGPLNDMQIASIAAYLNFAIPSHVPPLPAGAADLVPLK